MKKVILFLATTLLLFGCLYDNEEYLFPSLPGTCDTSSVSYATDIVPILSDYCYMCHSNLNGGSMGNNIYVEDYQDVVANAERIQGSIQHAQGFSPMPKGGGQLTVCKLLTFEAWISQGMQNN